MTEMLYHLSGLGVVLLLLAIIVGLIRPLSFAPVLRRHATRKRILIGGIALIMVFGTVLSVTEPASLKQARLRAEAQKAAKVEPATEKPGRVEKSEVKAAKIETKETAERQAIAFGEQVQNDNSLPKGQSRVIQEGKPGEKTVVYTVTYVDGAETGRIVKSENITAQPVAKMVAIGTYVAPAAIAPSHTPQPTQAPQSSNVYYANCTAARAAGVTPIYRGQSGYAPHLDRDNDGIACEN